MTGNADRQDPVALAIAFAERLGGETLPGHAAEKLRGDQPMSSADRVQIDHAFQRRWQTLRFPTSSVIASVT